MSKTIGSYQPQSHETYMNQEQQNYFRHKLLAWRDRLKQQSSQSLNRIRSGGQIDGDLIDRSVQDKNRTFDFITRQRNEEMIRKINAALKRLDQGTFGYCLESGEEIGLERLIAYPIATLAVDVQEFIESRRPRPISAGLIM